MTDTAIHERDGQVAEAITSGRSLQASSRRWTRMEARAACFTPWRWGSQR